MEFAPEALDPTDTPRPPYVTTAAERQRWDVCVLIAQRMVDVFEGPGENPALRWQMTRSLFHSEFETGDPGEAEELIRQASPQH
ncbi:MAG TPA: hypothetical protein VFA66_13685 [Gaiellaceae bacterium]|nr:hypothetical protein [Gaiellaceae bacterium]